MSLNGLDTAAVDDAYNTAIAEAGGWFLLKYTSRDSVELLGRGKGGVHEARQAIASYTESSPLYGLLIYRRRKVLIKYIPEGTSRLLQARTAVHFQDIAERYQPYETLLEITTAEGLNDTSLAASFPLHTASLSTSSNRLHEISEDAEDGGASPRRPTMQSLNSGAIFGTRQYKMEKRVDQIMRPERTVPPAIPQSSSYAPAEAARANATPTGKTSISSQFLVREDSGKRSITSISTPLSEQLSDYTVNTSTDTASREATSKSTLNTEVSPTTSRQQQSPISSPTAQRPTSPRTNDARSSVSTTSNHEPLLEDPSLASDRLPSPPTSRGADSLSHAERMRKVLEEPFDFSYLEAKQKVKLGPRPVAANATGKRSTTSGVSALPAHYRPTPKKEEKPLPVYSVNAANKTVPLPPIPNTPEYNPRPISRGSVKSMPSQKSVAMTPDKLRLMKAVELRKRQLRKSNPQLPSTIPGVDLSAPEMPRIPEHVSELKPEERLEGTRQSALINEEATANKADSGIEMGYEKGERAEPKLEESVAQIEEPVAQTEEQVEQIEDPITAEALKNDEAKAEAEGYGAIPTEEQEEARPRLDGLHSPKSPVSVKQEDTPPSEYSDARSDRPLTALAATQQAAGALRASVADETSESTVLPSIVTSPSSPTAPSYPVDLAEQVDNEEDVSNDNLDVAPSTMAKRRRGIVEPLNLQQESEFLEDDELMDELQSAVVSEAKPAAIARSPVAAYFPRRPSNQSLVSAQSHQSGQSTPRHTPAVSAEHLVQDNETLGSLTEPADSKRRSVSPMDRTDLFTGIRRNVSSGITKRFQALAENSHREIQPMVPAPQIGQNQDGSPGNQRVRSSPRTRAGSFKGRWGLSERSNSQSTAASIPESTPVWNISQDANNRDSINVKARIVRPNSMLGGHVEQIDAEDGRTMHESQLEISHGSNVKTLPPINTKPAATTSKAATASSNRAARQSASAQQEDDVATPLTATRTINSAVSEDAATNNSTGSRTSRFFKRMSSLGGKGNNKRRSIAQSITSMTSPIAETEPSTKSVRSTSTITEKDRSDMPPHTSLGDLNVQFPDTLLWKRRWITIDEAGNVVLGVPQALEQQNITTAKKFHLSEFKLPYTPDVDRQEMPHSICLDFGVDGGTLQIACEDTMSQRQILTILRSYWKSWAG